MGLGRYLCDVRAGQYWRLNKLRSFDEFQEEISRVEAQSLLPDGHPRTSAADSQDRTAVDGDSKVDPDYDWAASTIAAISQPKENGLKNALNKGSFLFRETREKVRLNVEEAHFQSRWMA